MLKQKSYNQQFSHIYVSRLQLLRDAVVRRIEEEVPGSRVLSKIIDVKEGDVDLIIVGTLLKELSAKPDVFAALTSEAGLTPIEQTQPQLASEDDQLLLEDESGRVELVGDIPIAQMSTGVVLGVRGRMNADKGGFYVESVFLPELPPQHALPEREESEYVALVSGLAIGADAQTDTGSGLLRNHLLVDYLAGRLGDAEEKQFVSRIVRTVIVGNSVNRSEAQEQVGAPSSSSTSKKKTSEQLEYEATPLKNADELLSSLASAMAVDLMPGATDPSNYALPQQSFHPCLFPCSSRFASFRSVTNPYEAQIGGVHFFGHSGQPLRSLLQCTLPEKRAVDGTDGEDDAMDGGESQSGDHALDCLQRCLEWRHAAPTAPDLLACFPVANEDPFILETSPHIFFAGNQKQFGSRVVDGGKGQHVRVITVPSFAETATIVLVDLKDLSCFPITIA